MPGAPSPVISAIVLIKSGTKSSTIHTRKPFDLFWFQKDRIKGDILLFRSIEAIMLNVSIKKTE